MNSIQTAFNFNGLIFPNQEIELTKLERKVLELIPTGKSHAKQGDYIAGILNIGKRTVTETVRRLRLKHFDIGSTTNNGYYRFKDEHEYLTFMASFEKELARSKQVINAMRYTPMAQKITVSVNEDAKGVKENDKKQ